MYAKQNNRKKSAKCEVKSCKVCWWNRPLQVYLFSGIFIRLPFGPCSRKIALWFITFFNHSHILMITNYFSMDFHWMNGENQNRALRQLVEKDLSYLIKNSRLWNKCFKSSSTFTEILVGAIINRYWKLIPTIPSIFQFPVNSTLIPTKLFFNEPPIKRRKTDDPATASSSLSKQVSLHSIRFINQLWTNMC